MWKTINPMSDDYLQYRDIQVECPYCGERADVFVYGYEDEEGWDNVYIAVDDKGTMAYLTDDEAVDVTAFRCDVCHRIIAYTEEEITRLYRDSNSLSPHEE